MRTTRIVVSGLVALLCVTLALPALAAEGKVGKAGKSAASEAAPAPAAAASPATASSAPSGQYRIGVISRKDVLGKYNKVKAEYEKLKTKVDSEQTGIDTLSKKIEGMKEAYEKDKGTMAPDQRAEKEAEIQKEYSQYRSMLDQKQREIDTEEQRLMKTAVAEIDQVVAKIAEAGGYHLVLEGGNRGGGVLYYSTTLDITQQVVDALNAK